MNVSIHRTSRWHSGCRAIGFTLVEVMVAMAVFSILLIGLVSAVALSSQAMPDEKRGASATLAAGRALEQLASDLACATSLATAAQAEMVLSVEDRNGDAAAETIRYAWSGKPGDPLVRQCNGGTPVSLANDVREFQLLYRKQQDQVTSVEVLLRCGPDAGSRVGAAARMLNRPPMP